MIKDALLILSGAAERSTQTCGCRSGKARGTTSKNTPLYRRWAHMKWLTRHVTTTRQGVAVTIEREHPIELYSAWRYYYPFKEWAEENGYEDGMHLARKDVGKGFTPDNCIWTFKYDYNHQKVKPPRYMGKLITYNGKTQNMTQWANEYSVNRNTFCARLRDGRSMEEALGLKPRKKKGGRDRLLTFNGKTQNVTAWAKERGINKYTLFGRLAQGWTVKEALSTPSGGGRRRKGRDSDTAVKTQEEYEPIGEYRCRLNGEAQGELTSKFARSHLESAAEVYYVPQTNKLYVHMTGLWEEREVEVDDAELKEKLKKQVTKETA